MSSKHTLNEIFKLAEAFALCVTITNTANYAWRIERYGFSKKNISEKHLNNLLSEIGIIKCIKIEYTTEVEEKQVTLIHQGEHMFVVHSGVWVE